MRMSKINAWPPAALTVAAMLAVIVSTAGCDRMTRTGGGWSEPASHESTTVSAAPVPAGRTRLLLAWRATDPRGRLESTLLRDDGRGYREVGRIPKMALFAQRKLWFLDHITAAHREVDCTCAPLAGFGEPVRSHCLVTRRVQRPVLVQSSGQPQRLTPTPADDKELVGTEDSLFELRASFGALLLGAHCVHTTACGAAHGSHRCRDVVWDAGKGGPTALLSEPERDCVVGRLRATAAEQFADRDPPVDDIGVMTFARVDVALDDHGVLRALAVFAGDTNYADSSDWAAYKTLERVQMPELPSRLRPYAVTAVAIRKAWSRRPARFGWSALELSSTEAERVVRRFSAVERPVGG